MYFLTRTFYPVGQGAFYAERFIECNCSRPFTVVYDCGSGKNLNQPENALLTQIKKFYKENSVIDILFISHFHSDHINGIKELSTHCVIKNIVVPALDQDTIGIYEKTIAAANNNTSQSEAFKEIKQIIDCSLDPKKLLSNNDNVKVIRIKSIPKGDANSDENTNDGIEYDKISDNTEINSGTPINIHNTQYCFWKYIPFNYGENSLKADLSAEGFIKDGKINVEFFKREFKKLIRFYKGKFKGYSNENSLSVASIPVDKYYIFLKNSEFTKCFKLRYRNPNNKIFGCMYFGDSNLKNNKLLNKIQKTNGITGLISTIQIPHHGSEKSFNCDIFKIFMKHHVAVISFGLGNEYKHPSKEVSDRIIKEKKRLFTVTQNPNSIHEESVWFFNTKYYHCSKS